MKMNSTDLASHLSIFFPTLVTIHSEWHQTTLKHNKPLGLMKWKELAVWTDKFSNFKHCLFKRIVAFQQYKQCQSCSWCHNLLHVSDLVSTSGLALSVPLNNGGGGAASREHWIEISYWVLLMKPFIHVGMWGAVYFRILYKHFDTSVVTNITQCCITLNLHIHTYRINLDACTIGSKSLGKKFMQ